LVIVIIIEIKLEVEIHHARIVSSRSRCVLVDGLGRVRPSVFFFGLRSFWEPVFVEKIGIDVLRVPIDLNQEHK